MNTVIVLLVAAIFFAIMGYKYPKTTVVCLILAVLTPNAELLNAFIFYSFFGLLISSSPGRAFLAGFGISLAWTVHQSNKDMKRSQAKDALRKALNQK
tara:strand:- start:1505 stop:1798 length:294 start_codon:yes stop_codon:yes gene_type:complete